MSRQPNFTREQCDQRIKHFLFERGFDTVSTAELADLLTSSRATIFGWYKDTAGIIAAGVRCAHADLLNDLKGFVEEQKTEREATRRAKASVELKGSDIEAVRAVFYRYCHLLDSPETCGAIILQATMLAPRVNQKGLKLDLGKMAASMANRHAKEMEKSFADAGFNASAARGRLLIAAATGLTLLPKGLKPNNRYEAPSVFFEAVAIAPLD